MNYLPYVIIRKEIKMIMAIPYANAFRKRIKLALLLVLGIKNNDNTVTKNITIKILNKVNFGIFWVVFF